MRLLKWSCKKEKWNFYTYLFILVLLLLFYTVYEKWIKYQLYLITYKNLIFFKNQMSQKISSGFYMLSCTIFSSVTDRQYLYVALFLLLQKLFLVDIHMWVDVPFILNSIYFIYQAAQVSRKLFKECTLRQDSDLHPLCSRNHCLIQCILTAQL